MRYIKYFFYLALNWNLKIAWHIILKEIKGEKKYQINTIGADELKTLEEDDIDIDHATIYMPVSYDLLEQLFEQIKPLNVKHFVDIGCGKGRALCVAAHYGISKVTGIDFSKELCTTAIENLANTKKKFSELNFKIINNDAFYFDIPLDVDCIFLFNPFDKVIMSGVVENIMISLEEKPRNLVIVYVNPLNKELFLGQEFVEIYHTKKMNYLEASILEYSHKGIKGSKK